ncbi:MAG: phosphate ABC transporter permease PstA [Coriobacteriia bacterium]|nr:phosphate ABC transporter permease PstA [Coriobacteriia bacterium]
MQKAGERLPSARNAAKVTAVILRGLVYAAAASTAAALLFIVTYILVKGIPNITPDLFAWNYSSTNVSLMPALVNTVLMVGLSLLLAVPLGIGAAIYLVEYTGRGNKLVAFIRLAAETLTGIPSIVYGLFGLLFFVVALGWGFSLMSGAFTLAIMILPIIMRTTEEALQAVPDSYREGSYGLGAGRLRTVFKILLPSAAPGILAGVILSIGRIVGESAALIYTAGTVTKVPQFLDLSAAGTSQVLNPDAFFRSTRTLSVHMYVLASEGLHIDKTYATAAVLMVLVLAINLFASCLAKRITQGQEK